MAAAILQIDLGRVDAVSGNYHPFGKVHIYRGRTHFCAQMIAGVDSIRKHMGMTQKIVGFFDLSAFDELADISGADDNAVLHNRGYNVASQTVFGAVLLQPPGVALAFIAKGKIVARDYPCHIQFFHQLLQKFPPVHVHDMLVEVDEHNIFYAELALDYVCPANSAVDKGHFPAQHQIVRVHVKAEHRGHGVNLGSPLLCLVQQRRVPDVYAVKKSYGNGSLFLRHTIKPQKNFL